MSPLWILNFSKKEHFDSFFETYWKASLLNDNTISEADKWFYLTDCTTAGFDRQQFIEIARRLTVNQSNTKLKLIPSVGRNESTLRVIFMGDITDECTIKSLHLFAAELRRACLDEPWTPIPNVFFYALLWRPDNAAIAPGVSEKTRGFLNELFSLENLNVNYRPFHKVIFMESSVVESEKRQAFHMMELAALQIAQDDKNEIVGNLHGQDSSQVFVNAGAASVFFEAKVQREQEAYAVGNLLLDRFCHSQQGAFFDQQEVSDYIDHKQAGFISTFNSESLSATMTESHPSIPTSLNAPRNLNTSALRDGSYREIWHKFFCKELGGFKVSLIDRIGRELGFYKADYLAKVVSNQVNFVNSQRDKLERVVFDIFAKDSRMKHIGFVQAQCVLERLRKKISSFVSEADTVEVRTFPLPSNLVNALEQAKSDHPGDNTTDEVLKVLESKLRTLPAFNLALIVRALILGFLFGFLGYAITADNGILTWLVTGLCVLVPLVLSFLSFAMHVKRINALKDQYVACKLADLQASLKDFVVSQIKKTYEDVDSYLLWIKQFKLDYLQHNLAVASPSDFTFQSSVKFQPLLNYSISVKSEDKDINMMLIPVHSVDGNDGNAQTVSLTGTFGHHQLLRTSPANKICIGTEKTSIFDLMLENGYSNCQILCKNLMDEKAVIASGLEKEIVFGRTALSATKLLILDNSGSMCGKPIEDLKDAVRQLQQTAAVEWIAFDNDVVATSFEGGDLDALKGGGGTCYVPAIQKAVEYLKSNYVDQVILISDGCPFESLKKILDTAVNLGHPLNTITIGDSAVEIMKQIAEKTGGVQIVVDNAAEIKQNTKDIFEQLQASEGGEFTFDQLLRKCRIDGCASALYSFTNRVAEPGDDHIAEMLAHYSETKGMEEWLDAAMPSCQKSQAAACNPISTTLSLVNGANNDGLNQAVASWRVAINSISSPNTDLDMVAGIFSCEILQLKDLNWAGFSDSCMDFNAPAAVKEYMQGQYLTNIYGKQL